MYIEYLQIHNFEIHCQYAGDNHYPSLGSRIMQNKHPENYQR